MTTTIPGLAPEPGQRPVFPWRFYMGQEVYLSTQITTEPLKVVGGEIWMNFPHLHVLDAAGAVWRVPQLQVMSKPLSLRQR